MPRSSRAWAAVRSGRASSFEVGVAASRASEVPRRALSQAPPMGARAVLSARRGLVGEPIG